MADSPQFAAHVPDLAGGWSEVRRDCPDGLRVDVTFPSGQVLHFNLTPEGLVVDLLAGGTTRAVLGTFSETYEELAARLADAPGRVALGD